MGNVSDILGKVNELIGVTQDMQAEYVGSEVRLAGHDVNPNAHQNLLATGNAASATKLKTARKIGGVSFDGQGDINLPGVNKPGTQDTTGNAASATKLKTGKAFRVALNSTEEDIFDGTKYCVPGVGGVLGTGNGGTGNSNGIAPSALDVVFNTASGLTMRGQGLLGSPRWLDNAVSLDTCQDTGAYYVGRDNVSTPFPSASCLVVVQRLAGAVGADTGAVYQWAYKYSTVEVEKWQRVRGSEGDWGIWHPAVTNVTPMLCARITSDGKLASGGYRGIAGISKTGTGAYVITTSVPAEGSRDLKPFVGVRGGQGYATAIATGVDTINVNTYTKDDAAADITFHIVAFTS